MRLSLVIFMLILLPVATAVHAWLFCRDNLPALTQEAIKRLNEAGVRDPVVEVRFFDIAVAGEAVDPPSREKAVAAIRALVPLRLKPESDRLFVVANLKAQIDNGMLRLGGWLPPGGEAKAVQRLLSELRPDLKVDATALHIAREVRWPEGVKPPLTVGSVLLKPIVEKLRVPAELHITCKPESIVLTGLLPDVAVKEEVVAALSEVAGAREVDPSALKASAHVLPTTFAKGQELAAFVREFFSAPPPRSFDIDVEGIPHLEGAATRQMESKWLSLLRPLTGAAKVDARLTLMPSVYHFPGYEVNSKLPPDKLNEVRTALRGQMTQFDTGSAQLTEDAKSRLMMLVPALLAAGPELGLVIGAHPDPAGPASLEGAIGRQRAEAVAAFLLEQGLPAAELSSVVFDPVPSGSSSAPFAPRSVEILVK